MSVKMAVLAPIPSASDSTAIALNTGDFFRLRRAKRISETRFTGIPSNGSYEDSAVQFPISAECYGDVPRPLPSSRRNREGLLVGSGNAIVRHQNARYAPQRIAKQRSTERPLCANGICVPV